MRPAPSMLMLAVLLGGCEPEPSAEDLAREAERDVAMVEQANSAAPPLREVTPEPIRFDDIEQHAMTGAACNYAPGTSLGTRAIAREGDAFVKLDGEVHRLAADTGSGELPAGTRSLYDGREYSLRLSVSADGQAREDRQNGGTANYQGTMSLHDRWGREVYRGTGLVQCGA